MQINSINSTSFGKLIYKKESGTRTDKRQQIILDIIDKDYRQNPASLLSKNVFEIGKYADSDVYVVAKKNGNIGLQIIEKDSFESPLVVRDCKLEEEMDLSEYAPRINSSGKIVFKNPILQFANFLSVARNELKIDDAIKSTNEMYN